VQVNDVMHTTEDESNPSTGWYNANKKSLPKIPSSQQLQNLKAPTGRDFAGTVLASLGLKP
jgi:hypothetical protein